MQLPFTVGEFLDVFRRYNEAVWPAPVVLVALAVAAAVFALRGQPGDNRRVNLILAVFWMWTAIAYHLSFFARTANVAFGFALMFAAQAGLFGWLAFSHREVDYRPRAKANGVAGVVLIVYALFGYPLLGTLFGHHFPATPTFGVPCPTTIFTLGLMAWAGTTLPRRMLVIPIAWALVGVSAAVNLGMLEDIGLPVAALVVVALALAGRRRAYDVTAMAHR